MKFAIIADIHANLEALRSVLEDASVQNCAHHAFLGDFVGYCADPKACIDIIRALNAPCVKGNYDDYCASNLTSDLTSAAKRAAEWTRNQLTEDDRRWLHDLPYFRKVENFTIVHATLNQPERWGYVFEKGAAAASFAHQDTDICFFGHTHVPVAFIRDTIVRGGTYTKFKIKPGAQYFVNPGSVGQPRDKNRDAAAYVTYDIEKRTIELRRVIFDAATTQRKIRESGLGK
ncbi:MAG TPA: metallophosphoesterase family protein [Verrucomicrobiae bacterium]|nr:metallophosphoesterase family protein [Verrucomicrobiae bacterium]